MPQRKSRRQYSTLKTFSFFIASAVFFSSAVYFVNDYLKIRNININTPKEFKELKEFRGLERLENKNILFLDINQSKQELQTLNPVVSNIKIEKKFPNTLKITFGIKTPIAYLKANEGYFYLSKDSDIIKKTKNLNEDDKDLPELFYYQSFDYKSSTVGSSLDLLDIEYSLSFLDKVLNSGFEVISIDIDSPNMIRLNLSDATVIFTTEKDIDGQINNLDRIIKQFKVEGKFFELLDLRFDKPILKLK